MNLLCDFSLHEQSFKEVVLYIELMKRSMKSKTFFLVCSLIMARICGLFSKCGVVHLLYC